MKKITLLFFCLVSVLTVNAEVYEGSCGTNVRYSLDTSTGVLSITGTGAMTNYDSSSSSVPWYSYRSYIKTVEISDGVTSIGNYAFYECSGLTSVTIPNSVTSIGSSAFDFCSGLTSVTIPNSVTSIGSYAFYGCYFEKKDFINNSSLDAEANNYWRATIIDSRNDGFVIKDGTLLKYTGNESSVTIPNSVTSIGSSAFYTCSKLTSVTIPTSVTSIGDYAFSYCSSLTSITIPNSVTSIKYDAFKGCSGLTSVHITDLVAWCNISFSESGSWDEISESYHYRGYYSNPLYNAHHLFIDGKEITDLVIPDGVTSIKNGAFYGCSGLTSVTIPNSVTSIGKGAFENCTGLNNVYCYAENVPSTDSDAFSNSSISSATLSVPEISFIAYKTTSPWSGFGTINTLSGEILKCATPTIALVNDELLFSCETEDVEYEYKLTMLSPTSGTSSKVSCPPAYIVSVYATKAGYVESDVASKVIAINSDAVRGDVNGDGKVGMPDAMFIVNKMLNGKFPDEGEDTGYYWYVGQIQQYDMATKPDIIISSSNVSSEGWREINNTPDNYTSLNPLFNSNINIIEFNNKPINNPSYLYLPKPYIEANLKMYDVFGNDPGLYLPTDRIIIINGIEYKEYKRSTRHTGFSGILLYKK